MSVQHPQNEFYKVDVDALADVADELDVKALPAFMAFKNGVKVGELIGASIPDLKAMVDRALADK